MTKVLFLGTHGQKNWGDEMLLNVFIKQLEPIVEKFYVNSYEPKLTSSFLTGHNVEVFNTQSDRFKLLAYLYRCDAVVFGGGSIIKELYTAYGGKRYATLQVLDKITAAAKMLGKPIYFSNIGIGPVETTQGQKIAKRILNRGQYISVRDSESKQFLDSHNISTPFVLASDAVFTIDRKFLGLTDTQDKKDTSKNQTIGINLCRNIRNNDNWDYFMGCLSSDIVAFNKIRPVRLVGIPMQFDTASNNDEKALSDLADLVHKDAPEIWCEISKPASIRELAAVIDGVDMVIAERLHTLILSAVIGKPLIALEYDVKVTGIMQTIGLSKYGLDINEKFADNSILKLMQHISSPANTAAEDVRRAYETSHEQAVESFETLKKRLDA